MKSMKCSQLGGACEEVFTAESFEEIALLSQQHGKEMFAANDQAHIEAMNQMMELMQNNQMESWMDARRVEFDAL